MVNNKSGLSFSLFLGLLFCAIVSMSSRFSLFFSFFYTSTSGIHKTSISYTDYKRTSVKQTIFAGLTKFDLRSFGKEAFCSSNLAQFEDFHRRTQKQRQNWSQGLIQHCRSLVTKVVCSPKKMFDKSNEISSSFDSNKSEEGEGETREREGGAGEGEGEGEGEGIGKGGDRKRVSLTTEMFNEQGYPIVYNFLPETDSTQNELRKFLLDKENEGLFQLPSETSTCHESPLQKSSLPIIGIQAGLQLEGKGTKGRNWLSSEGNLYLTLGIPRTSLPLPMGYLPLRMGVIVCEAIRDLISLDAEKEDQEKGGIREGEKEIKTHKKNENENENENEEEIEKEKEKDQTDLWEEKENGNGKGNGVGNVDLGDIISNVKLKWPNDVLVYDKKVAGLLIEMEKDYFLVGIGVNVASTPLVPTAGGERGRPATSLASNGLKIFDDSKTASPLSSSWSSSIITRTGGKVKEEEKEERRGEATTNKILHASSSAQELSFLVLTRIKEWLDNGLSSTAPSFPPQGVEGDSSNQVLQDWRRLAQLNFAYELRDEGTIVYPVDIKEDGSLIVRDVNGKTRVLIADYLH